MQVITTGKPASDELPRFFKPPHVTPETSNKLRELRLANPWASNEQLAEILRVMDEGRSAGTPPRTLGSVREKQNRSARSPRTVVPDKSIPDSEGSDSGLELISPLTLPKTAQGAASSERPNPSDSPTSFGATHDGEGLFIIPDLTGTMFRVRKCSSNIHLIHPRLLIYNNTR